MRTPPLWGLRLRKQLLHDGSALSPEQAIERHGGDAARVRDDSRARMHYAVGDMHARVGLDSLARRHLFAARTLAQRDTVTAHDANARLALLDLTRVASVR